MAQAPKAGDLPCRDIERVYGDSGCKCVHYRRLDPNGDCQNHSVSKHSPGEVEDAETLCRLVLPKHLWRNLSAINPYALRAAKTLGLSVIRARHVSHAELGERALTYAERWNVPPSDVSLATARCGDVRAIMLYGAKGYNVYDSATGHDPAHADVCRALAFPPRTPDQRSRFKELRELLADAFTVMREPLG